MKQKIAIAAFIVMLFFLVALSTACMATVAPLPDPTPLPTPTPPPTPPPPTIVTTRDNELTVGFIVGILGGVSVALFAVAVVIALIARRKPDDVAPPMIHIIVGKRMYSGQDSSRLIQALMQDGFTYYQAQQIVNDKNPYLPEMK